MKVILIGYGRMGKMIEELLAARGDVEILGAVSPGLYESPWDVPGKPTPSSTFPTPATSKPRSRARRTPPPPSSSAPPA